MPGGPTIRSFLTWAKEVRGIIIGKPEPNRELFVQYKGTPIFGLSFVGRLILGPLRATPVHRNREKTKGYVALKGGVLLVVVWSEDNGWQQYFVSYGNPPLIVQPNQYHAVLCLAPEAADVLVLADLAVDDVEWEEEFQ